MLGAAWQTLLPTSLEQKLSRVARDSIQRSRADRIKEELVAASGDVKSTWRAAERLLHSNSKVIHNDADYKKLASNFSWFFVDKINQVRINIELALHHQPVATRRHDGPTIVIPAGDN